VKTLEVDFRQMPGQLKADEGVDAEARVSLQQLLDRKETLSPALLP